MHSKHYSIAESKNRLPALIHEAENDEPIFIHRRGKPVAVLLSLETYTRLTQKRPRSFTQAYDHFQALWQHEPDAALAEDDFDNVRDSAPGRNPPL